MPKDRARDDLGELPLDTGSLIELLDRVFPPGVSISDIVTEEDRIRFAARLGQRELIYILKDRWNRKKT